MSTPITWRAVEDDRERFTEWAREATYITLTDLKDIAVAAVQKAASTGDASITAAASLLRPAPAAVRSLYRTIYRRVVPHFAEQAYQELRDLGDWIAAVQEFLAGQGGQLIQAVSQQTIAQVMEIVQEGVNEGEGIEEIARRLDDELEAINRHRARTIARTEVIRASNYGALVGGRKAAAESGLTLLKEWIAADDSRTRRTHREADGQQVPLEGLFEVGGFKAPYPAAASLPPKESIMCRCTLAFVPVEEDA